MPEGNDIIKVIEWSLVSHPFWVYEVHDLTFFADQRLKGHPSSKKMEPSCANFFPTSEYELKSLLIEIMYLWLVLAFGS